MDDDYTDEGAPAQAHCKQDGCPCGKRCSGPYLVGLGDNGQPVYGTVMTVMSRGEED